MDHLKEPEIAAIMDGAKVIYSAGFFITACSEAVIAAAEHCLSNNKTYAVVCPSSSTSPGSASSLQNHIIHSFAQGSRLVDDSSM